MRRAVCQQTAQLLVFESGTAWENRSIMLDQRTKFGNCALHDMSVHRGGNKKHGFVTV